MTPEPAETFPFASYDDFARARAEGRVVIAADPTVSREWLLHKGKYSHTIWWLSGLILSWIPFVAIATFFLVMMLRNLIMLLWVPALFVAFLLSSPHAPRMIRQLITFAAVAGFGYQMLVGRSEWIWLLGTLSGIMVAQALLHRFAFECFVASLVEHEDLLMDLHNSGLVSITRR